MSKLSHLAIAFSMTWLFLAYLAVDSAWGATRTWNGSSSTSWALAGNWVEGAVPVAGDDVVINGYTTNAPTLDLNGGEVTINSLSLGASATSVLTLANGDMSSKRLVVNGSVSVGAMGTLTHTANSTTEQHRMQLVVGGDFTLAIGGLINLDGRGYSGGSGTGNAGNGPGGGSALGGAGGGTGACYYPDLNA